MAVHLNSRGGNTDSSAKTQQLSSKKVQPGSTLARMKLDIIQHSIIDIQVHNSGGLLCEINPILDFLICDCHNKR